ncbi:uncharacterized protein BJX67DRAFT_384929 [Aspergillus lucknowensis]|uniref:HNH nuclease domain-containing protein n=1 Tax=Aspergillus lucknowensis TaxID=176173 RepID=A0ABR4LF56_9EURO
MNIGPGFVEPERDPLIRDIVDNSGIFKQPFNPAGRAFFRLADIEKLHDLVKAAKNYPSTVVDLLNSQKPKEILQKWLHDSTTLESYHAQHGAYGLDDIATTRALCKIRDLSACTVTKADITNGPHLDANTIQTAHILPPVVSRYHAEHDFWNYLRRFFTDARVDRWYRATRDTDTLSTSNLITLSRVAHAYWRDCRFALRPLPMERRDSDTLRAEFSWLPCGNSEPRSITGKQLGWGLFNYRNGDVVRTGDVVEFWSTCVWSKGVELPCWDILEMRWYLSMMSAMCDDKGDVGDVKKEEGDGKKEEDGKNDDETETESESEGEDWQFIGVDDWYY